jgi:hypothetical protein
MKHNCSDCILNQACSFPNECQFTKVSLEDILSKDQIKKLNSECGKCVNRLNGVCILDGQSRLYESYCSEFAEFK